jgi:hypothetical protein
MTCRRLTSRFDDAGAIRGRAGARAPLGGFALTYKVLELMPQKQGRHIPPLALLALLPSRQQDVGHFTTTHTSHPPIELSGFDNCARPRVERQHCTLHCPDAKFAGGSAKVKMLFFRYGKPFPFIMRVTLSSLDDLRSAASQA